MNRNDRRHFEKGFRKVLRTGGDHCGLCGKALEHNCKTFGGFDVHSQVVLSGECCAHRLAAILVSGVYVTENIESLPHGSTSSGNRPQSQEDVSAAINAVQSHFSTLDKMSDRVMKQGGIQRKPTGVSMEDTPWKTDDAAWFKSHPSRSHRMRPIYDGEAPSLSKELGTDKPPENYRYEILVRQVEVGKRVRTLFCRNMDVPIPDTEEVVHGLFDIVAQSGTTGVISFEEVEALALKYGVGPFTGPH